MATRRQRNAAREKAMAKNVDVQTLKSEKLLEKESRGMILLNGMRETGIVKKIMTSILEAVEKKDAFAYEIDGKYDRMSVYVKTLPNCEHKVSGEFYRIDFPLKWAIAEGLSFIQ